MKDYYKTLGLSKGASEEEIKSAYRKLAHKHHPNRPGGDEQKMKEVNEAYEILSNKEKKSQYDRFGSVGGAGGYGQGGPFGGFSQGGFNMEFDPSAFGDMSDLGDIFEAVFEGMGVRQKRRTYRRGSDLQMVQEITLEEAFKGIAKDIDYKINVKCSKCSGVGHDPKAGFDQCSVCGGRGEIKEVKNSFFGNFVQVKSCDKCFGTGQIPKKVCDECRGLGKKQGEKNVKIEILPGVSDNQMIKIKGAGEAGERNAEDGDLYVKIRVKPHPIFERHGNDLLIRKEVNMIDVLLGKKIEMPTISGKKVPVEIPGGFDLRGNIKIAGEGMPYFGSSGHGNLIVELVIKTPKKVSAKAKKALEDLEDEIN